ncbi:VOC family protein [Halobaculum lipolyticum]|uniref:VOC family protein n=1 Tax=Halobaculum lipolyticum TaxID=3032001 RepID=A0ABD5W6K2_9EURY|nr:VOC family protein [Halobaculum sp. DT31]
MHATAADFVFYNVDDIERAVSFYRDTLGLPLEAADEEAGWAEFAAPPTTLVLWHDRSGETQVPETGGDTDDGAAGNDDDGGEYGSGDGGGSGGGVALAVDDVESAVEELRAAGTAVHMDPIETSVCDMAVIGDPAGNTILLHRRHDGTTGRRDPFP